MPGLEVASLTKNYGSKTIVDRVSFEVAQGQFCILLGPSGCGKTTLLRMIAGLVPQDEGLLFIGGRDVSGLEPKDRDIAMVFQSYALYPHLSVYDNLAFPLAVRKTPRRETDDRVRQAAALLEIEHLLDRKPAQLSGGQRQRVAIGRALVRKPSLFLFDEPLSNLDAQLRSSMRLELARLHRSIGGTIVYVTHDQTEAMTLGQKIIVFDNGEHTAGGKPAGRLRPAGKSVCRLLYRLAADQFHCGPRGSGRRRGCVRGSRGRACRRGAAGAGALCRRRNQRRHTARSAAVGRRPDPGRCRAG